MDGELRAVLERLMRAAEEYACIGLDDADADVAQDEIQELQDAIEAAHAVLDDAVVVV